ncbi:enoyl-CoA hydratase-related protein [Cumulibacter manganitolerans]|uniref:enoyl-CoA hydratase-related protein n=1 Tax=Cumulibacter manganitolerans TaxID=1884992 RepID=UPI001297C671|nr:enoyl-CoA hydratase-related protein [Cumulibacter manganitolerans]
MAKTETGTDDLLAEVADGVGTLTFNRPEARNAMSGDMMSGLADVLADWADDDEIGAVVITGAGGAFCAGGDVKGFNERGGEGGAGGAVDPRRVDAQRENQKATVGRIYSYPKPVIGAIPGAAAGAGLGFALATDVRVGTPKSVMATAFGGVGLSGDYGVTWLLNQLVGPAKARQLMFFNDRVRGDELLELGLLNWIVPEDELQTKAFELAKTLADGPRGCFSRMKANLAEVPVATLEEAMDAEVQRHLECGVTADHREAVAAFVEKRKPVFRR